jgi:xanthosine utilization system XapX-like protein
MERRAWIILVSAALLGGAIVAGMALRHPPPPAIELHDW